MTHDEAFSLFHNRFDGVLINGFTLQVGKYPNGRPALQAFTEDWEPYATITVNLVDQALKPGEFFVHYTMREIEGDGLLRALEDRGLASCTGRTVSAGLVVRYAEVWRL